MHRVIVFVTLCSLVYGGIFDKGFFTSTGNTLWDELYEKCGNRVSFYCVQNKLMNYINNTLDSDLYITDGIYFVKNNHRLQVLDSNSVFDYDNSTFRSSRTGRAVDKLVTITDNNIENTTEPFTEEPAEEEEFTNFIKSVEKVEKDLETSENYEGTTETPANSTAQPDDAAAADDEEPESENLVIRSLNKVTDILYDKTTDYLSTHDLKLDLPQTFFGGSKVRISPRGFDSDGGIIIKLNVDPAETPRTNYVAKYIRK